MRSIDAMIEEALHAWAIEGLGSDSQAEACKEHLRDLRRKLDEARSEVARLEADLAWHRDRDHGLTCTAKAEAENAARAEAERERLESMLDDLRSRYDALELELEELREGKSGMVVPIASLRAVESERDALRGEILKLRDHMESGVPSGYLKMRIYDAVRVAARTRGAEPTDGDR